MKMLPFALAAGLMLFLFPLQAQLTLQDSLVAFYPMSGNAQDMSGNGNHGTVVGATLTADRFGNPNEAYLFDGVNDYLSFLNNQNLQVDLPVTIAAWVNLSGGNTKNPIFLNDWAEDYYHGVWILYGANQRVGTGFGDGGPVSPGSRRSKSSSSPLQINTWHHIATIIRGPMDMSIYIDGREDCGTYNGTGGPMATSGGPGRAGVNDPFSQPGTLDYFHGAIDDIRLYNRELSESEIEELAGVSPMNAYDTVCIGQSLVLEAPAGYQTYTWLNASTLSCSTCPNPAVSFSAPAAQTWQAVLTKSSGCVDTFTVQVEAELCCSAEFSAVILKKTGGICPEDSIGSVILAGSGGTAPYLYAMNGSSYGVSGSFNQLNPGSYQFSIQDSAGCEIDTTVQISPPPPAILTSAYATAQTNFGVNDGTATVTPSGGNGGPWTFYWSNGATTDSIFGLAPGIYTVEVKDAEGCTVSDTVEVLGVRTSLPPFPDDWFWSVSPNPVDREMRLSWELPASAAPVLRVLDLAGRELKFLRLDGRSGKEEIALDLPSGIYLLHLEAGGYSDFRRLVVQ